MIKKIFFVTAMLLTQPSIIFAQATWTQKANFGGGNVTEARAFSIGNFGYFGGPLADLWRYDSATDSWSQMATFTGPTRLSAVAFSIGTKGYLGTGGNFSDFYEYDAISNSWTQIANFGGSAREGALGISIDGKGYVGTGGSYLNDWWEFNPATNAWTQKANLAGPTRYHGGAFTVGGKGYVSTGFNGTFFNDLWQYDPALNSWASKSPLPAVTRDRPVGLGTATKGYILTGWNGSAALNDAWEYDPITDTWTQLPSMPTAGRYNSCGFTISNKLYIGAGYINGSVSDFWEFGPDCISQTAVQNATCNGVCDGTAIIAAPDSGAIVSYLWSNGQNSPAAVNLCAGSYIVTVIDTTGCSSVTAFTIDEPDPVTALILDTPPTCFGDTDGALCAAPVTSPLTYLWANGDTSSCLQNIGYGIYILTITDTAGCAGIASLLLSQPGAIDINFNVTDASCSTCANGSASAQTSGGTSPLSYSWSTGSTLAFINNLLPGIYTCCVTDANGCMSCDSVEVEFSVGMMEVMLAGIKFSPNPFNDHLFLSWDVSENAIQDFQMYDISAREIIAEKIYSGNSIAIPTSHIRPGIYILKIETKQHNFVIKVVKD